MNCHPFKFFDDDAFIDLKNTLDNRMKDLSKEGKIAPCVKAEPISVQEEEMMWNLGILGDDTPTKLMDTLLYLLGVHFALHAADEHKSLKIDIQIKVMYDANVGLKYLYYEELTSKCNQGGISDRSVPPKSGRAYQNIVNSDRCVIRLYEKYVAACPSHDPKYSKDFYLRPLSVPNGDVWYSCQARGRHTLSEVIKKMCKATGLGECCTNHSCRASSATRMYEQGADEQLICEKTGHRSVAVRSYKRTSNIQLKEVSDMLYGNRNQNKVPKVEATSTISKAPTDVKEGQEKIDKKVESEPSSETHSVEVDKGLVVNINVNVTK